MQQIVSVGDDFILPLTGVQFPEPSRDYLWGAQKGEYRRLKNAPIFVWYFVQQL